MHKLKEMPHQNISLWNFSVINKEEIRGLKNMTTVSSPCFGEAFVLSVRHTSQQAVGSK